MIDWSFVIAVIAILSFLMSGFMFITTSLDKSLSIREHEEYKRAIQRELDQFRYDIHIMEQTRPTTGEIEARLDRNGIHLKK